MIHRHAAIALLAGASLAPAWAQTVYRCPGGYSQQPCAGGTALDVGDERTPGQRAQTSAAARRDAQLADSLEKERLRNERQAPAYAPPAQPAPVPKSKADPARRPGTKPEVFTAAVPGSGKDGKKKGAGSPRQRKE